MLFNNSFIYFFVNFTIHIVFFAVSIIITTIKGVMQKKNREDTKMKKITVADILNLDIMNNGRLIAGEQGLSNPVHYVNIYDNPISEINFSIQLFSGDIYLTFFYYGMDNPNYIMESLNFFVNGHAAALIIFDEYMKTLPDEAIDFCNENNFPVVFLDCKTPYSLVISSIMEYKIAFEQKKTIEDRLIAIASPKTPTDEKLELISDLNPHFQKNVSVLFSTSKNNASADAEISLINAVNRDMLSFAAQYKTGILLIVSYSETRLSESEKIVRNAASGIKKYLPDSIIGVSNSLPLLELGSAISQSHLAARTGAADSKGLVYYKELGVSRILLDLLGTPTLENFYQDVLGPIEDVDRESNTCLLETMLAFTGNGMDYKKTSKALFVHENTIRYRINRIKDLIPYGKNEMDFYETISVVSKIYKMKNC